MNITAKPNSADLLSQILASPSARSYNRAYLATGLRHFGKIQPNGWASDTLGTLDTIPRKEME